VEEEETKEEDLIEISPEFNRVLKHMHKLETLYKEGKVKHSAERDDIDLSKIDASKPIVVLDMDETMLSATQDNSP